MENDTYRGGGPAELARIQAGLQGARNLAVSGDRETFYIVIDSASGAQGGGRFTIARQPGQAIVRTCANAGRGACDGAGEW